MCMNVLHMVQLRMERLDHTRWQRRDTIAHNVLLSLWEVTLLHCSARVVPGILLAA